MTKEEKATLRDGGTPAGWSQARTRQIDRDGRWTLKRGRKARRPEGGSAPRQAMAEIAVPVFDYKNRLGIDRAHGFIRRFVVTDAARHDGGRLGAVLDPPNTGSGVWADTAYRSRANLELLERRTPSGSTADASSDGSKCRNRHTAHCAEADQGSKRPGRAQRHHQRP